MKMVVEDQPAGSLASHYVRQLEVRASAAAIDITFLRAFYCQACRTPFLPGVTRRVDCMPGEVTRAAEATAAEEE